MTNLASGDGEGDGRSSSMPRLQLDGGPVHVDIVLGIHGIRCGKRVLDLALGSGVQLLGLLTEGLSQILDPVALFCNSGFQFRYVPVPQDE